MSEEALFGGEPLGACQGAIPSEAGRPPLRVDALRRASKAPAGWLCCRSQRRRLSPQSAVPAPLRAPLASRRGGRRTCPCAAPVETGASALTSQTTILRGRGHRLTPGPSRWVGDGPTSRTGDPGSGFFWRRNLHDGTAQTARDLPGFTGSRLAFMAVAASKAGFKLPWPADGAIAGCCQWGAGGNRPISILAV